MMPVTPAEGTPPVRHMAPTARWRYSASSRKATHVHLPPYICKGQLPQPCSWASNTYIPRRMWLRDTPNSEWGRRQRALVGSTDVVVKRKCAMHDREGPGYFGRTCPKPASHLWTITVGKKWSQYDATAIQRTSSARAREHAVHYLPLVFREALGVWLIRLFHIWVIF